MTTHASMDWELFDEPVYTATDVSAILRVPRQTVRYWAFGRKTTGARPLIDVPDSTARALSFANLLEDADRSTQGGGRRLRRALSRGARPTETRAGGAQRPRPRAQACPGSGDSRAQRHRGLTTVAVMNKEVAGASPAGSYHHTCGVHPKVADAWALDRRFWPRAGRVARRRRGRSVAEQGCWCHKLLNVLDKLPRRRQPRAKGALHE
jgi:hypothetical protein